MSEFDPRGQSDNERFQPPADPNDWPSSPPLESWDVQPEAPRTWEGDQDPAGRWEPVEDPHDPGLTGASEPVAGTPPVGEPTIPSSPAAAAEQPWAGQPPLAPVAPQQARSSLRRRGPGWAGVFFVAILTALATLGASYLLWGPARLAALTRSGAQIATQAPVEQAPAKETNWEAVAKAVQPAVVSIQVQSASGGDTGSGVIFDTAGHVLTNHHVIAAAVNNKANLTVQLSDGRLFNGSVVGTDSTTDLAVLSIQDAPEDLHMVSLGSSSQLTVGSPVAAIGAPLGLDNTMTTGIISALDRPVIVRQQLQGHGGPLGVPGQGDAQGEAVVTNAIQVDAAINPGNSGGPLFSADGSVIGITSSIASLSQETGDTSGSIGIGFAIPVNLAKTVADQILSNGHAEHAYLGVLVRTAPVRVGDETVAGAELSEVLPDSAAAAAQLRSGDVIIGISNRTVSSGTALTGYVRWYVPGDNVEIVYVRDGEKHTAEVTLGRAPNT